MYQERRKEEDMPVLKTALMHRYDSRTTKKKHERGLITAIRNSTDNTKTNRMTMIRKQKWQGKQL